MIDGKTLCDLSDNDLYSKVEDGGLGLKPLQLKRIRAELGESSNASSVGSAASLCQKSGNRQTDDSADSNARTHTHTIYSAQVSVLSGFPSHARVRGC